MATPKHVISGLDYKNEAPLIMENLRELSDQMTFQNIAGERLRLDGENGVYMVFGKIDDTHWGILLNDGTTDRVFIGFED
jgi:hypothetical protein